MASLLTKTERAYLFATLNDLVEVEGFMDFIEDPTEDSWYNFEKNARQLPYDGMSFPAGASKGVIVDVYSNYVIKIPFYLDDIDYCRVEWRNYLEAVEAGLDWAFAPTDYIGRWHGVPIYAQKYMTCNEDATSEAMFNSALHAYCEEYELDEHNDEVVDNFCDEYYSYGSDEQAVDLMREVWGEDAEKIMEFCDEFCISDLHNGNLSYDCDNLVMVDFSGYGTSVKAMTNDYHWDSICRKELMERRHANGFG